MDVVEDLAFGVHKHWKSSTTWCAAVKTSQVASRIWRLGLKKLWNRVRFGAKSLLFERCTADAFAEGSVTCFCCTFQRRRTMPRRGWSMVDVPSGWGHLGGSS